MVHGTSLSIHKFFCLTLLASQLQAIASQVASPENLDIQVQDSRLILRVQGLEPIPAKRACYLIEKELWKQFDADIEVELWAGTEVWHDGLNIHKNRKFLQAAIPD
ncbi:MAG: hypothetical protein AAFY20_15130 [Cyanobacteria bacterium J06639_14]